jgi:ribosomal protein S10
MKIVVIIVSKNKNSVHKFLKFLKLLSTIPKFSIFKNFQVLPNKKIVRKFSILRSPHVHKQGQEQFEFKKFSKKIYLNILSTDFKFLLILKKIKLLLFSDVNYKIRYDVKNLTNIKISPKNINLRFNKNKNFLISYLKILNYYGKTTFN